MGGSKKLTLLRQLLLGWLNGGRIVGGRAVVVLAVSAPGTNRVALIKSLTGVVDGEWVGVEMTGSFGRFNSSKYKCFDYTPDPMVILGGSA